MTTRAEVKATQVVYPWKAALRTALQVGIPTLVTLGVVIPEVIRIVLEEFGEQMPDSLRLWLIGAAGIVTGAATVLARIMAIPAVNAFLTRFGIGATPKHVEG